MINIKENKLIKQLIETKDYDKILPIIKYIFDKKEEEDIYKTYNHTYQLTTIQVVACAIFTKAYYSNTKYKKYFEELIDGKASLTFIKSHQIMIFNLLKPSQYKTIYRHYPTIFHKMDNIQLIQIIENQEIDAKLRTDIIMESIWLWGEDISYNYEIDQTIKLRKYLYHQIPKKYAKLLIPLIERENTIENIVNIADLTNTNIDDRLQNTLEHIMTSSKNQYKIDETKRFSRVDVKSAAAKYVPESFMKKLINEDKTIPPDNRKILYNHISDTDFLTKQAIKESSTAMREHLLEKVRSVAQFTEDDYVKMFRKDKSNNCLKLLEYLGSKEEEAIKQKLLDDLLPIDTIDALFDRLSGLLGLTKYRDYLLEWMGKIQHSSSKKYYSKSSLVGNVLGTIVSHSTFKEVEDVCKTYVDNHIEYLDQSGCDYILHIPLEKITDKAYLTGLMENYFGPLYDSYLHRAFLKTLYGRLDKNGKAKVLIANSGNETHKTFIIQENAK